LAYRHTGCHGHSAFWYYPEADDRATGIIVAQISIEETAPMFSFFKGGDACTPLGQCHIRLNLSYYPLKDLIYIRKPVG
jgi:hypothetical protein